MRKEIKKLVKELVRSAEWARGESSLTKKLKAEKYTLWDVIELINEHDMTGNDYPENWIARTIMRIEL